MKSSEEIKKIFDEFVFKYDIKNDKIKLKYDHTFRVANNAKIIAKSLNLKDEEIYIAYIIGILHDIGRFYQIEKYNTFSDFKIKKFDHGDLGEDILRKGELKKYLNNEEYAKYSEYVYNAVKYHNKFKLTEYEGYLKLSDDTKQYINIIRDADKLDILYIVSNKNINIEENYDYSNISLSNKIYDTLMSCKQVRYEDVKTKIDNITTHLGYVYDINFKKTFEEIYKNKYIEKYIELFKFSAEGKIKMKNIKNHINKYIEDKLEKL